MKDEQEIKLVEPCEELKDAYIEYLEDFRKSTARQDTDKGTRTDFTGFVQKLRDYAKGIRLPQGWVPATAYWLVCSGRILGTCDLRHRLTELLRDEGGHIGYGVRPSERGNGSGTLMLGLLLAKARELGLAWVLIICDKDNVASARVIQKNGGKLDSESISKQSGKLKQRYWIES